MKTLKRENGRCYESKIIANRLKWRKKNMVIKHELWIFFFFCKGISLTTCSMEKKENTTGRITKNNQKKLLQNFYIKHTLFTIHF